MSLNGIINILKENSRLSLQKIAKKTGLPITTVHHRLRKLEKNEIIEKYTIKLNQKKIGKPLSAYVLITVDYKDLKAKHLTQQQLARKLKEIDDVNEALILAGGADIILKIQTADIDHLNKFLTENVRNVEGVEKTQTMIVLEEV